MWAYIEASIRKMLLETVTESIQQNNADVPLLNTFRFTQCSFGDNRPKFPSLKVRSKGNLMEFVIQMDWDATGSEIAVSLGSMAVGMKNIQLRGPLLLVFSPLLNELPITGAMSITFPDPPEFKWEWTGIGSAFKALAGTVEKTIVDAIFEPLVVPSRVYIDIAGLASSRKEPLESRVESYRTPDPIGVLHMAILEAKDLPIADFGFAGGSSDPYVVVKIGSSQWQTAKLKRTLNPVWGQAHSRDFLIHHMEQHVFVDVYDSDIISFDDLLGFVVVKESGESCRRPTVSELTKAGQEKWWPLSGDKGEVKIRCFFREVDDDMVTIDPIFVSCNQKCDLLDPGGNPGATRSSCSLCGASLKSWKLSCTPCGSFDGKECPTCNFRVCRPCSVERRPAAAMLRVCIREGLVPAEDVHDGVVLGVSFEGHRCCWQVFRFIVAVGSVCSVHFQ